MTKVSDPFDRWKRAYEQASFYKSVQNTVDYWDGIASSNNSGIGTNEHIIKLAKYLNDNGYLESDMTILDVGCGQGDYIMYFADKCDSITALDYSNKMLEECQKRCLKQNINNVIYINEDIGNLSESKEYDGVLACLNPATYSPEIFLKLLNVAKRFLVYFSMDIDIEEGKEPIYNGTNSVRYPEAYLSEHGIKYTKIPYDYIIMNKDGKRTSIPFAYIVVQL